MTFTRIPRFFYLKSILPVPPTAVAFFFLHTRKITNTAMTTAAEAIDATIGTRTFFLGRFLHALERQSMGFPSTLQVDKVC